MFWPLVFFCFPLQAVLLRLHAYLTGVFAHPECTAKLPSQNSTPRQNNTLFKNACIPCLCTHTQKTTPVISNSSGKTSRTSRADWHWPSRSEACDNFPFNLVFSCSHLLLPLLYRYCCCYSETFPGPLCYILKLLYSSRNRQVPSSQGTKHNWKSTDHQHITHRGVHISIKLIKYANFTDELFITIIQKRSTIWSTAYLIILRYFPSPLFLCGYLFFIPFSNSFFSRYYERRAGLGP